MVLRLIEDNNTALKYSLYTAHRNGDTSLLFSLSFCTGFGWDKVKFLHSSFHGAMFWICDENSVDNTGMF